MHLWLAGANVPLEEELRDALPPTMQQVWTISSRKEPSISRTPRSSTTPRSTALQRRLPGGAAERDGLDRAGPFPLSPRPAPKACSTIATDRRPWRASAAEHGNVERGHQRQGDFLPTEAGGSASTTSPSTASAATASWSRPSRRSEEAVAELNPSGPIYLRGGQVELARAAAARPIPSTQWNLEIGFQQVHVDFGLKLDNLSGALRPGGEYDGRTGTARGELDVDSLSYKDLQFTQVRGPIWIDDEQCCSGPGSTRSLAARAAPARRPATPSLTGKFFGGTVFGDAGSPWAEPALRDHAGLTTPTWPASPRDILPGRQNLQGKMSSEMSFRGRGGARISLGGHGSVAVPQRRRLRTAPDDRPAENPQHPPARPDRLQRQRHRFPRRARLYFDRIDFNGDAISLLGTRGDGFPGKRQPDLLHHRRARRLDLPVLSDILGGASQQLMLIHVDGTLQNPETRREPLPGVKQAMQQLQAERQRNGLDPLGLFPRAPGRACSGGGCPRNLRYTSKRSPAECHDRRTQIFHDVRNQVRGRFPMSIGPLGGLPPVRPAPLAQAKGSEVERTQQDVRNQERRVNNDLRAETAAGIGEADGEDHETAERDADGRRLWEEPGRAARSLPRRKSRPRVPRQSKDASGQSGTLLDLTG